MRKLSLFLTLLVLVVGGAMAAVVFLVPPEFYKQKIEEQVSTMLGRELRIEGPVSLKIWPSLQARAQNVTLANPPGFSSPDFATMKVMRASVALIPLFSKRVEINEFTLVEPKIVLEKRRDGAVNWAIGNTERAAERANANAGFERKPGALPLEASLGEVRLIDGDIQIIDNIKDRTQHLSAVNLDLSMPALDAPMTAKGKLALNGTAYALDGSLGGLKPFLEGEQTPLTLKLDNALFSVNFDGAFDQSTKIAARGELVLRVPSVRKLAAAAGSILPDAPGAYGAFVVSGLARANTKRLSFKEAQLSFDNITGTGSFGAIFAGAKPRLSGNLDIPSLDLTPYLPPPAPAGRTIAPWSTAEFDLQMLKAADARFTLSLGELKVRDIKVGKSVLKTVLKDGRLQADLSEMALYSGRGTATVVANAKNKTPSFSLTANIADVEFHPLLIDAIKFRRLAGTGAAKFSLLSSGNSQAAIMNDLSGNGSLRMQDGKIIGINLAAVLRSAQSFITTGAMPAQLNEEQVTDFTDLSASFGIRDGVATTNDFLMLAPVLRVPGEGTLGIGAQTVDFRLTPRAVASLKGQGGQEDLLGLKAPFRIHGPWNGVKAGLDTKLIKKKAKKKIKKEVGKLIDQNLGGGAGSALKSLFKVPQSAPGEAQNLNNETPREKTDEEMAVDALVGLFKKKKKKKKSNNN